jgi:hypothetical protein
LGQAAMADLRAKQPFSSLNRRVADPARFAIVRPTRPKGPYRMTPSHGTDYQPGSMDISQHKKFYQGFLTGSKWVFVFIMGIVILMAIFRTNH